MCPPIQFEFKTPDLDSAKKDIFCTFFAHQPVIVMLGEVKFGFVLSWDLNCFDSYGATDIPVSQHLLNDCSRLGLMLLLLKLLISKSKMFEKNS